MKPTFLNPDGFDLTVNNEATRKAGKTMFNCVLPDEPSTRLKIWWRGMWLEPNRRMTTDLLSSPLFINGLPGLQVTDWIRCALIHDSGCNEGGLWWNGVFIPLSRREMDDILATYIPVEGVLVKRKWCAMIVAPFVWIGVRIGALLGIGKPRKSIKHQGYSEEGATHK